MDTDEQLVIAVRAGNSDAFAVLVDRWLDRCWEVAWRILHDRDGAADIAQDTLLVAWEQLDRLDQAASFGGWVLRIARNRALNRLERERRAMPVGDDEVFERTQQDGETDEPVRAVEEAEQRDLVWAAAAALGERDASLLDLHLRHGLEPAELATELGVTPNHAHQLLFRMRGRLGGAVRAWLLWRHGEPECVVLQAELAAARAAEFDKAVLRLIDRHVRGCPDCDRRGTRVTAPAAMFSAVPFLLAPGVARAQALEFLSAAGVPVPSEA